jgi:Uma2 family endonuclease
MNPLSTTRPIDYPDSDGMPMAENTLQFQWIVTIEGNLAALFASRRDVFVAGDLLWYPVEGDPTIRQAPDALVVFGRPPGHRGSYRQWDEAGIAPQVVWEILSPGNRLAEMTRKFKFYERYGVVEYYVYDPDRHHLTGWKRDGNELKEIEAMHGFTSPLLGIRFEIDGDDLRILRPDGKPFLTFQELAEKADRAEREKERVTSELQLANWEKDKALKEKDDAVRLVERQAEELERLRERLKATDKGS